MHATGATVLYGRCDEEAIAPYRPWVDALRHYVNTCPPEDLAQRLGARAAELARLIPAGGEAPRDRSRTGRGGLGRERYRLSKQSQRRCARYPSEPPVLVLDDLLWADRPTLLLLKHVMRSPEHARLLILGTYRDTGTSTAVTGSRISSATCAASDSSIASSCAAWWRRTSA